MNNQDEMRTTAEQWLNTIEFVCYKDVVKSFLDPDQLYSREELKRELKQICEKEIN